MRAIVLGSAAGGGYPQWNCRCATCRLAYSGDPRVRPGTQCSLAVTADGERWLVLNASPDIRQQILATPALHPREGLRDSPIGAVLLTNGDVDAIAGLLTLRESQPFALFGGNAVMDSLAAQPVFQVLNDAYVARSVVEAGTPFAALPGLTVATYSVPGKIPLWLEGDEAELDLMNEGGQTIGVEVRGDDGHVIQFVPGCAAVTPRLAERLAGADIVFFDGTLWSDHELVTAGVGHKTGRRMGHISMSGPDGSMAALAHVPVRRKVYVHINNTNPALVSGSPERKAVEDAGWDVGFDGMEVVLT
ncbi:pyrroloquinoline quinone biosynthesis protein PqqB [Marinivivus vitaminiproducens]|uniref:pyrroloquinoline quinone biosynthesis protein PqqB n=1 Tax=Marinivivus vitaminiproducens TaxID=3035935 RepID=UPI003F9F8ED7